MRQDFSAQIQVDAYSKEQAIAALEEALANIKSRDFNASYAMGGNGTATVSVYAGPRVLSVAERVARLEAKSAGVGSR